MMRITRNDLDHAVGERPDKACAKLAAGYALAGYTLRWTHPNDGPVSNYAQRWRPVRNLTRPEDERRFPVQIRGTP